MNRPSLRRIIPSGMVVSKYINDLINYVTLTILLITLIISQAMKSQCTVLVPKLDTGKFSVHISNHFQLGMKIV